MGLLDDDDLLEIEQLIKEASKFKPLELNEINVDAIFHRCLATSDTKEYIKSVLEQQRFGYAQDSKGILFDRKKLQHDNIHAIEYLYGQLLTTHNGSNTINTVSRSNVMKKYTGETWTTNRGYLLQLFHLGVASGTIYPFNLTGDSTFTVKLRPTLSPNDPNFPTWWEAHKAEWGVKTE